MIDRAIPLVAYYHVIASLMPDLVLYCVVIYMPLFNLMFQLPLKKEERVCLKMRPRRMEDFCWPTPQHGAVVIRGIIFP